ncbi:MULTISPECIES: hypothetical protein [Muribaculum]|uniref:hypothetical protein n=1 Tax=Muribaculum TaxID=1918540 RepID=UPI00248A9210|nr:MULTISPECIES: hypothetical protein [Muribaculum]
MFISSIVSKSDATAREPGAVTDSSGILTLIVTELQSADPDSSANSSLTHELVVNIIHKSSITGMIYLKFLYFIVS